MRRCVVVLALAACGESPDDRLGRLIEETEVSCWSYFCDDGPNARFPPPEVSTEQGVACMTDALASGARASARWGVYDWGHYKTYSTYVFTIDHQIEIVTTLQEGPHEEEVQEAKTCSGPFRVGAQICSAMISTPPYCLPVHALAWDGCE